MKRLKGEGRSVPAWMIASLQRNGAPFPMRFTLYPFRVCGTEGGGTSKIGGGGNGDMMGDDGEGG